MNIKRFDANSRVSVVTQVARSIREQIEAGTYSSEAKLPSINKYSREHNVARDTIEKAYNSLKRQGYVTAVSGKGYFVRSKEKRKLQVLLIFNKLSYYKKVVFDAVVAALGTHAQVDLQIHHYDPAHLADIIESNLGRYDHYVIMPHFFRDAEAGDQMLAISKIPPDQLILLDKRSPFMPHHKGVYQDFQHDIFNALALASKKLVHYHRLNIVYPEHSHQPREIVMGVEAFCHVNGMGCSVIDKVEHSLLVPGSVFVVLTETDLARLIKGIKDLGYTMGNEIGIISFNDTLFKELLDITVISTDFNEMGRSVAELIRENGSAAIANPFSLKIRGSL